MPELLKQDVLFVPYLRIRLEVLHTASAAYAKMFAFGFNTIRGRLQDRFGSPFIKTRTLPTIAETNGFPRQGAVDKSGLAVNMRNTAAFMG
jgi:hypothetical protein